LAWEEGRSVYGVPRAVAELLEPEEAPHTEKSTSGAAGYASVEGFLSIRLALG